jgi:5-methylcytosine-specific restriction endonuclease McrA
MKRRKPLRPVSARRAAELKQYTILRRAYLSEHPHCEVCGARAHEIHHMLPRGRGGKLLDTSIFLALCRRCHRQAHDNPNWAYKHNVTIK